MVPALQNRKDKVFWICDREVQIVEIQGRTLKHLVQKNLTVRSGCLFPHCHYEMLISVGSAFGTVCAG